ncbi:UNVERIFIED_ORG: hypothetical protein J2X79_004271 [Arthrobacter globiformis]|nr:hypothetical protein [Arthrobacter globiformis]
MTSNTMSSTRPWVDLEDDDLVTVSSAGQVLYRGRIDGKTADGQIVWILPSNDHRRLIHAEGGVEVQRVDA